MIELSNLEIEEVSGGMGLALLIALGNAVVEFGSGLIDGMRAAQS